VNPALRISAAHVFVASLHEPEPEPDDAHHLFRVLRLRDGETVTVSDGVGSWRSTVVAGGALVPSGDIEQASSPRSCLVAAAIPKGDRCEWMVQKLTEVGASEIVLLHCARSVVRWEGDRGAKQLARMQRVAREASMQSRRAWLPVVRGPVPFAEAVSLLIGPEGGFSPEELAAPVPRLRLLDTVLRVETAAVVAAARILMVP
jgi:16S rRNA (uracil1498-N3)-methyltransferase